MKHQDIEEWKSKHFMVFVDNTTPTVSESSRGNNFKFEFVRYRYIEEMQRAIKYGNNRKTE
ncbi:hypothetical protein QQP08_008884 [Theobroma cacao]|nr:hypothetical protein QQP08_008884 [Theobroma cacao]